MCASDTQQWTRIDVIVKGNQAVSRKYSKVSKMKIVKKEENMQPLKTVYRQTGVSFSEGAKIGQIDKLLETYTNTVNYMNLHYYKIL